MQQTVDGVFLVAGWSNSFDKNGYGLYLVKIDANGKKIWEKTRTSEKFDPDFAIVPYEKGYIVTGWWAERLANNQSHNDELEVFLADFWWE
ncbi:hypothetical protein [Desulfallas thermosapovorans]|uniref:hypothetical protein n=1 Tax=Desulfallas thermosapovorans TaxID=58137 RepID=UPI0014127062|nr:hypothetical protein [Desulfallas thermosapovorans]